MDTSANTSPDQEPVHASRSPQEKFPKGNQEALSASTPPASSQPGPPAKSQPASGTVDGQFAHEGTNAAPRDLNGLIPKPQADTESKPIPDVPVSVVPRISVKNVDQPANLRIAENWAPEPRRPNYEQANNVSMGTNHLHRALQPAQIGAVEQKAPTKGDDSKTFQAGPLTPSGDNGEVSQHASPGTSTSVSHPVLPPIVVPSSRSNQKSVAEVLAEHPKPALPENGSSQDELHRGPITPVSQPFTKSRSRSLIRKARPKHRSKMSTVVFGKQRRLSSDPARSLVCNRAKAGQATGDDYFKPLFIHGFTANSKWMKPLEQILHHAHKTVSTPDASTPFFEHQACRVLRSVYSYQNNNKWSLRQPKRCPEPTRQPSHWDQLLKEMKWLRTDFREERKWKIASARNLASACAEWYHASPEDRKMLQVNASIPPAPSQDPERQPTPELVPSGQSDSPMELEEEPHHTRDRCSVCHLRPAGG